MMAFSKSYFFNSWQIISCNMFWGALHMRNNVSEMLNLSWMSFRGWKWQKKKTKTIVWFQKRKTFAADKWSTGIWMGRHVFVKSGLIIFFLVLATKNDVLLLKKWFLLQFMQKIHACHLLGNERGCPIDVQKGVK